VCKFLNWSESSIHANWRRWHRWSH